MLLFYTLSGLQATVAFSPARSKDVPADSGRQPVLPVVGASPLVVGASPLVVGRVSACCGARLRLLWGASPDRPTLPGLREAARQLQIWRPSDAGPLEPLGLQLGVLAGDAVHVGENLGDGHECLFRNRAAQFNLAVEELGKWLVFDNRDLM